MAQAKKSSSKTIIDVAHPGESAPSSTSKPVIVTNRPILKDPMVVDNDSPAAASDRSSGDESSGSQSAGGDSPGTAPLVKSSTRPRLHPLSSPDDAAETAADTDTAGAADSTAGTDDETGADAKTSEPPAEAATAAPAATPDAAPDAAEDTTEDSVSKTEDTAEGKAEGDAGPTTDQAQAQSDAEAKKQAEHNAAIQKLVDSKQYFLPINAVEKRKTKRFILLGVVIALVLVAAWADIAMDAGLVHINGVKPVTHFFSN